MIEMGVGRCTGPQPLFKGYLHAQFMNMYMTQALIPSLCYLRSTAWVNEKNIFDLRLGHLVCEFFSKIPYVERCSNLSIQAGMREPISVHVRLGGFLCRLIVTCICSYGYSR